MERLDECNRVELLKDTNARLGQFFTRFEGRAVSGSDQEVEALRQLERLLQRAGALLHTDLKRAAGADLLSEVDHYRQNLLRLRAQLDAMQSSTLEARERLISRDKHLQSLRDWCAATRSTRAATS